MMHISTDYSLGMALIFGATKDDYISQKLPTTGRYKNNNTSTYKMIYRKGQE